jgi:Mg2+ and Co2+ transporter CorA
MEETQKEAISMRTIAFVTMFFLPATFVSSFFDLPFFQSGVFNELPHVWIYFVIVFALTIVILTVWRCWLLKKYEKIQKNEAHAFLRKITEDFS